MVGMEQVGAEWCLCREKADQGKRPCAGGKLIFTIARSTQKIHVFLVDMRSGMDNFKCIPLVLDMTSISRRW
jgi:hypothetical protein